MNFLQTPAAAAPQPGLLPAGQPDHHGLGLLHRHRPLPPGEGRGRLPLHRLRLPGDLWRPGGTRVRGGGCERGRRSIKRRGVARRSTREGPPTFLSRKERVYGCGRDFYPSLSFSSVSPLPKLYSTSYVSTLLLLPSFPPRLILCVCLRLRNPSPPPPPPHSVQGCSKTSLRMGARKKEPKNAGIPTDRKSVV